MSKKQEENGEPPVDRRIKVLSMGAAGVGKSCLIKRYCEGKVRYPHVLWRRRASTSTVVEATSECGLSPYHRCFCLPCDLLWCPLQFVTRYISTIGVDFGVKPVTVRGKTVKVNFWDLSGQPEFFEIRNEFYKNTQGVRQVLVLCCTRPRSGGCLGVRDGARAGGGSGCR